MEIFYSQGEIMSMGRATGGAHIAGIGNGVRAMILSRFYRAVVQWAARPVLTHASENALWRLTPQELADLPIGPEPEGEGGAFEAERSCGNG